MVPTTTKPMQNRHLLGVFFPYKPSDLGRFFFAVKTLTFLAFLWIFFWVEALRGLPQFICLTRWAPMSGLIHGNWGYNPYKRGSNPYKWSSKHTYNRPLGFLFGGKRGFHQPEGENGPGAHAKGWGGGKDSGWLPNKIDLFLQKWWRGRLFFSWGCFKK